MAATIRNRYNHEISFIFTILLKKKQKIEKSEHREGVNESKRKPPPLCSSKEKR
jgi:hypothetical protein